MKGEKKSAQLLRFVARFACLLVGSEGTKTYIELVIISGESIEQQMSIDLEHKLQSAPYAIDLSMKDERLAFWHNAT